MIQNFILGTDNGFDSANKQTNYDLRLTLTDHSMDLRWMN